MITSDLFEAFLKCSTKCYLLSVSEEGTGSTYSIWKKYQSESFRREGIKRIIYGVPRGECTIDPPETSNLKTAKWTLAVNYDAQAESMKSRIHAVERISSEGRGKPSIFIPIRFVPTNKLSRDDKLILAFDAHLLSGVIDRNVGLGKIIHGDEYLTQKVKTSTLASEVRKLTGKISSLLSASSAPDLILNQHCPECDFLSRCRQKAVEKDDLSLLSGLSEKERKKLNGKGIFTVTQLSYTFRPRRRPRLQAAKHEKYHHSLKALAIRENKIHVVGNSELKIEGTPVYLDVEGFPDRDFHYLIGIRMKTSQGISQQSFWADTMNDEKRIWDDFLGALARIENPILIHYGSYETAFLKLMCERYGGPPEDSAIAKAIAKPVNILSFIYARIYFPTYSNGLKDRARFLGFEWSEPDASGALSIMWRGEWEIFRDEKLKERLINYNAEDCEALQVLTGHLQNLLLSTTGPVSQSIASVVGIDSLPKYSPYKFGKTQFQISTLETINRAAYWDYQRERVLARSSKCIRKTLTKSHSKNNAKKIPINKTIIQSGPKGCPKCESTNINRHQKYSRIVLDVRFNNSGIKRWLTEYLFWRYRCKECWFVFYNNERAWGKEKYGVNLRALTVYSNIELLMPQVRVADFLNDILGFDLNRGTINKLKASAAEYYQDAYEKLIGKITHGRLVHADETRVNLKAGIGYVWVFTNLEEVAFVYAPSREGELLHSLFKDFKGVLVSDFYAAYDSLDCPQQKCLIHLIRDINDDLMKEPYNEEMKCLAGEFATLLKTIIGTVDRFGLKAHYLHKHKVSADRFFKRLIHQEYRTETALKLKTRFLKNRDCLFTFLDYNGIPWNNNNAEHAIKAFALLRRDFKGVTTEKGVREYLVLLSIYETCKFKGVSFLDFLRSGEKDFDLFTANSKRT